MNEEPKNIWKQPWRGLSKAFAWFALLVGATFVTVFGIGLFGSQNAALADTLPSALAISVCFAAVALFGLLCFRWLCCWRRFRWVLFIAACLVTLLALAHAIENWRGHRAWENLQREAAMKGERFDLASIIPPPVVDAENFAMAPIFEGVRHEMDPEWRRAHTGPGGLTNVNRFTLNPYRTNGSSSDISLGSWPKAQKTDLHAWQDYYRTSKVDSAAEFPVSPQPQSPAADVLLALRKFDPMVEELWEAGQRPYSRFPVRYEDGFNMLLPHLARLKGCNQLLALRSIAELSSGQGDRALADVKLSFRLVDSVRTEPMLISHLVRIAQFQIALQPVWEGLADHKWSDAQLAVLDAELAKLDFLADYQLAMRGEWVCSIWAVDYGRRTRDMSIVDWSDGSSGQTGERAYGKLLFRFVPGGWFDQNKVRLGRMHLLNLSAVNREARTVSPDTVQRLEDAVMKSLSHPTPYNVFARMLLPALAKASEKFARGQTCTDLARVACALERHRLAHGQYPQTLDELAPRFLAKLPHDVIGGQPLKYRRTDDGQFVLYSVGWNETDDGGQVELNKKGSVVWENGDWVWRYPMK